ncbi:class I SAM-dependent methyltransferase [Ramlibacter sp. PS4R-6]|uniref:class I SAM-dependent methyltransferase n=1 Tax=Ramlibacter sp. PS4R-6 TaxID=3133438 RepID=UPI0030A7A8EE
MSAADYPLLRDAAEHERLDAQARFWSADAHALFAEAGVERGWRVADLGSGTLHVAEALSEHVGAGGRVVALDSDRDLVRRNAAAAHALRRADVRIEHGDAYATGWPADSFDAAHARFLAAPAGRLPGLVAEMRRIVRPGGCVMLQEPDANTWSLPGASREWLRLREWIRKGFALRRGDFDAGRALLGALADEGFEALGRRCVVRTLPADHPYAALPFAFARQLAPLWLREGIVGATELEAVLAKVRAGLAAGGIAQTFTLVQAWGRRPVTG